MQTLKNKYNKKKNLSLMQEKLQRLDKFTQKRLNEEIDKKLLNNIVNTIQKLQAIDFGNLTILDEARDAVVIDVTRTATGDQKSGFINRLASLFRDDKNPLFDALAFGSAIANFFPQLARLLEALASKGGKKADEDETISQIITSDELESAVKKVITQGLRPSGVLTKLGAGWANRYLKGSVDDLIDQIMESTLSQIKTTAQSVKQATGDISKVAQDAQQKSNDQKSSKTKATDAYEKIKNDVKDIDDETVKKRFSNA